MCLTQSIHGMLMSRKNAQGKVPRRINLSDSSVICSDTRVKGWNEGWGKLYKLFNQNVHIRTGGESRTTIFSLMGIHNIIRALSSGCWQNNKYIKTHAHTQNDARRQKSIGWRPVAVSSLQFPGNILQWGLNLTTKQKTHVAPKYKYAFALTHGLFVLWKWNGFTNVSKWAM